VWFDSTPCPGGGQSDKEKQEMQFKQNCNFHLPTPSNGGLDVAMANTSVGVSPELLLTGRH
jgi:hypothetical protein